MEQVLQDLYKRLGYSYIPRSKFTGYIMSDHKLNILNGILLSRHPRSSIKKNNGTLHQRLY